MSKIRKWNPLSSLRPRQAPNIPVTYMQEHIENDLGPAITTPPLQYASEISAFVDPGKKERLLSNEAGLFSGAEVELERLKNAIVEYHMKTKPHPHTMGLADDEPTWEKVQDAVKVAASVEGSDDESSIAKRSCSKMIQNLPAFEAWLDLLPGGDYGTVVCGMFKIIVRAAKRANEVRILVFKALAEIPECIARAEEYRGLYAQEKPQGLMQKTAQLCSTVLVALRYVMKYFTEGILSGYFESADHRVYETDKHTEGGLKAMVQGPAYKETLQNHLNDVKELTTIIDREAFVCSHHRLKAVESHVIELNKNVREWQSSSHSARADQTWTQDVINQIGDHIAEKVVNGMLSHLSSNSCIGGGMTWSSNASRLLEHSGLASGAEPMNATQVIDTQRLLSFFSVTHEAYAQEVRLCVAKGGLLEVDDQDRVKWIMSSKGLRSWLNFPKSKLVLINDNYHEGGTFGPTTFLAAKTLESLEDIDPIVTLHFFCSLHTVTRNGVRDDAVGVIESLIVQLIQRSKDWDLTSLNDGDLKCLGDARLDSLCALFGLLIGQLPEMTLVFLVIDGINLYESIQRRQGILELVKELLRIMNNCPQLVIKLLLTCHGRSSFIQNYINREDTLTVPADIDGDRQGWSERHWKGAVGKEVEELGNAIIKGA